MSEQLTASRLLDRVMKNVGIPWQSQRADGFGDGIHLGRPDTVVTGIATTFTPTVDVLKRAVASGKNTIICRETPFYSRGERAPLFWRSGPEPPQQLLEKDATARAKRELIESNNVTIIKLFDNWDARNSDAQLRVFFVAEDIHGPIGEGHPGEVAGSRSACNRRCAIRREQSRGDPWIPAGRGPPAGYEGARCGRSDRRRAGGMGSQ